MAHLHIMYERQQNTLYHKGDNFLRKQFLETFDWFTAYDRGKVFILS